MNEVLLYIILPGPCQGPYKDLPGGWRMNLCDECMLFPCPHWEVTGRPQSRHHAVTVDGP